MTELCNDRLDALGGSFLCQLDEDHMGSHQFALTWGPHAAEPEEVEA